MLITNLFPFAGNFEFGISGAGSGIPSETFSRNLFHFGRLFVCVRNDSSCVRDHLVCIPRRPIQFGADSHFLIFLNFQLHILDIRLVFCEQNFAESAKCDCTSRCAHIEKEEKVNELQRITTTRTATKLMNKFPNEKQKSSKIKNHYFFFAHFDTYFIHVLMIGDTAWGDRASIEHLLCTVFWLCKNVKFCMKKFESLKV